MPEPNRAPVRVIPLGTLVSPHGTRGEVRLRLFNPESVTIQAQSTVLLQRADQRQQCRVTAVRRHKQLLLLSIEGCTSMDAARALVGWEVCVPEQELPAPAPGEVYHYELRRMTVVTTTGVELGRIADVLVTAGNDVCVVRDGTREYLIPLIADVVKAVDRTAQRLIIEPLPGLLEP